MLSLTSLRCFVAAAEERNVTRAAKRLFISQQALSNHISKLEAYYDVRLFDRGTPLTLTDAGRALQRRAAEILSSVDDYAREVQDIKTVTETMTPEVEAAVDSAKAAVLHLIETARSA